MEYGKEARNGPVGPALTKIVVPEGMMGALHDAMCTEVKGWVQPDYEYAALEAALRWLSDNPIVPTREQIYSLQSWRLPDAVVEWQRRMFLAPKRGPFDDMLDAAERNAPVGSYRIDLHTAEGTLLASRELNK